MLSRFHRLTKKSDFDAVFRRGRAFFLPTLGLKVARNGLKLTRFGFVVGTVVDKQAVVRNKIKRRLREHTRLRLNEISCGFDVVVLTRPGIELLTRENLLEQYVSLLQRAGILNHLKSE